MSFSVTHKGEVIAIIVTANYHKDGIEFLTPDTYSQQLGYMARPAGYKISAHTHNPVLRSIQWTQEVLFIRSGRVRVDLYSSDREYIESYELAQGDVILLASGGHGFTMLEESEILEVKQGPYSGDLDKTLFEGIHDSEVQVKSKLGE